MQCILDKITAKHKNNEKNLSMKIASMVNESISFVKASLLKCDIKKDYDKYDIYAFEYHIYQ